MAIFEPIEITEGGKTFKRLSRNGNPFWAVGYNNELTIILMTVFDENAEGNGAVLANVLDAPQELNGFGSDTYQELVDEIENRGLTYPPEIEE